MVGLLDLGSLLLLLLLSSGLGGSSLGGSSGLGLLLGRSVLDGLLNEGGLSGNGKVDVLVADQVVPTVDSGVGSTELGVKDLLHN